MTRLFWKTFAALWLSIMGFSVLMTLVSNFVLSQHIPDTPEVQFSRSVDKADKMLSRALNQGGPQAARKVLQSLPLHIRNHVFLFDDSGSEVLGRERVREHMRESRQQHLRRELVDRSGNTWHLVVLRRAEPGRFLSPDRRGGIHRLLIAAVVAALASFVVARFLTRPLEDLGAASRRLASGDLAARVGFPLDSRRDEFGNLARDLDEMAANLQQSHRANRRLLRDVSHELRSPLARLRVAVELARSRDPGNVGDELSRIELEGQRLEELVDQVLGLLRESSGDLPLNLESFDLCELMEDLREVVIYEVPEGAPGVVLDAPCPLVVTADRELIWRAVENLLRNALIHSGGQQAVMLTAAPLEEGGVEIRVADSGPGVPESELTRMFDAFYRVDEARDRESGGHGLGLAIAAASVRRHRGEIQARNRDLGGLEITIRLPEPHTVT